MDDSVKKALTNREKCWRFQERLKAGVLFCAMETTCLHCPGWGYWRSIADGVGQLHGGKGWAVLLAKYMQQKRRTRSEYGVLVLWHRLTSFTFGCTTLFCIPVHFFIVCFNWLLTKMSIPGNVEGRRAFLSWLVKDYLGNGTFSFFSNSTRRL